MKTIYSLIMGLVLFTSSLVAQTTPTYIVVEVIQNNTLVKKTISLGSSIKWTDTGANTAKLEAVIPTNLQLTETEEVFTLTAGQTKFTLLKPAVISSLQVFVNGVNYTRNIDFTTSEEATTKNTVITFIRPDATGPDALDVVKFHYKY